MYPLTLGTLNPKPYISLCNPLILGNPKPYISLCNPPMLGNPLHVSSFVYCESVEGQAQGVLRGAVCRRGFYSYGI